MVMMMLATVVIRGVAKKNFSTKIAIDHNSVSRLGTMTKPQIRKLTQHHHMVPCLGGGGPLGLCLGSQGLPGIVRDCSGKIPAGIEIPELPSMLLG